MIKSIGHVSIKKVADNRVRDAEDELAVEEPLEIRLGYVDNGKRIVKNISVTMRTPGADEELAAGFMYTEGIISNHSQIISVDIDQLEENIVMVSMVDSAVPVLQKTERNFYTTSSCGVCGKSSIDAIRTVSVHQQTPDNIVLNATVFYGLQEQLRKQQLIFETTGGLHAAALFDLHGNFINLREDVGRHNALDKLIGRALLDDDLPLNNCILLLSGRASFELVQKAVMAGVKVIAAVGAPSSLAVQLAEEAGITLLGFLRNNRFNIYTCWQRVII